MSRNRRQFLRDVAAASVAAAGATVVQPRRGRAASPPPPPPPPPPPGASLPIVIATWDYGLELVTIGNDAPGGVNVVESDPKVSTVGVGGLPNEDGVVQLDAAI